MKYTEHTFHFRPFICALYVSCHKLSSIPILHHEINESTNSKSKKKGTQKQCYHF